MSLNFVANSMIRNPKHHWLALLLIPMIIFCAFQWPWDVSQESAPKTSSEATRSQKTHSENDEEDNALTFKVEKKATLTKDMAVSADVAKPDIFALPGRQVDPVQIKTIEAEIDKIFEINDTLQKQYGQNDAEIKKIMTQARIHRQILQSLESQRIASPRAVQVIDVDQVLEQEKIREIAKDTMNNRVYLNKIRPINSSPIVAQVRRQSQT